MITYKNMDCLELMRSLPDKSIDLAIVDPPYYSGPEKRKHYGKKVSPIGVNKKYDDMKTWEVPDKEYFDELFRVSKHQIIWGCNYYDYNFGPGRIIWDKCNGDSSFSDCEIAYCSKHDSVRMFKYMWIGMMQGKSILSGHIQQGNKKLNEKRIHPTQKPVNLYKWILTKYATEGDKILDTHVGSASSLIACHDMGYDVIGSELDEGMYTKSSERLELHTRQLSLFNCTIK